MSIGSGPFGPQIDVTGTGDITRLGEQVERILTGQLEQHGIDLHDRLGRTCQRADRRARQDPAGGHALYGRRERPYLYGDMNGRSYPRTPASPREGTGAWPPCCAYATRRNACSPSNATRTPPTTPLPKASGNSTKHTTGSPHPTAGSTPKRTCACRPEQFRSEPQPALHVGENRLRRFRSQRRHALQEGRHAHASHAGACGRTRRSAGHQPRPRGTRGPRPHRPPARHPGRSRNRRTARRPHRHRPGRRHSTAGGRIPVRRRGRRTRPCRRTIACHGRRARTGTCTRMARRKRDTGHNTALARGKLP